MIIEHTDPLNWLGLDSAMCDMDSQAYSKTILSFIFQTVSYGGSGFTLCLAAGGDILAGLVFLRSESQ